MYYRALNEVSEFFKKCWLWLCADDALHDFTIDVNVQCWDRCDAVLHRDRCFFIGIQLNNLDARVLGRNLIQNWSYLAAWTTPFCPEINEYWG